MNYGQRILFLLFVLFPSIIVANDSQLMQSARVACGGLSYDLTHKGLVEHIDTARMNVFICGEKECYPPYIFDRMRLRVARSKLEGKPFVQLNYPERGTTHLYYQCDEWLIIVISIDAETGQ